MPNQDILINPNSSGDPTISFIGSGLNATPITLKVLSNYQSASGSGSAIVFDGSEGRLFSITDNLSSGIIFNVGGSSGLSLINASASGDVKIGEYGRYVGIGYGDPVYGLDVFSSGNFRKFVIFNSGIGVSGSLLNNNVQVSVSGHTHVISDILNFNSGVNNLVSGVYAPLSGNLSQFASTSSAQLASIINNETGTGILVFNNSPVFSGTPTVPTASSGTNNTQIASTAFVRTEIANLIDSAPATLDTLNELAAALGDDPNFATTVTNLIGSKVSKSGDTMTGALIISPTGASPSGLIISPGSETNLQNTLTIDVNNYLTITNAAGGTIATEDSLIEKWNIGQCEINGGSGNFASLKVNNTDVSVSGHSHTSSDITNFNTGVSGLLPSVSGSGYVNSFFNNNIYTISVSGLQPSGNYSVVGHTHTSSNITDFNTSVSGILPVQNIVAGSNITVSNSGGIFTINSTGGGGGGGISPATYIMTHIFS